MGSPGAASTAEQWTLWQVARDHRQVINGVLHRVRTGVQWRDLPERFGPWKTVHKRHLQWSADGTWERPLRQVQAVADAEGSIDWDVSVDSMVMRAHQHAAGARKAAPPQVASKGATVTEHQIDPAWTCLAGHLEEVVLQVRAWAALAAASPPRST
ncbi:hypothetical protein CG740_39185 [Streptomyces sp. CB01201]|nr:hypothetical protein CG740_39185 [Streptomyces sp. CB01201]